MKNWLRALAFVVLGASFASPPAHGQTSAELLFYRSDGVGAVGHIDPQGAFVQTQSINNFSSGWTQIVSVGDNLLFYRSDGLGAVGHIDPQGSFVQTQSINTFSPGWTQIVSAGENLLFYRSDGLGAVGHIDPQGSFVQTQSINTFSPGWTRIISVGDNLLFYRSDGLGAVGHIDPQGAFVQTQSINTFSAGWTQIVSVGDNLLFYRSDGLGAVGHIDPQGAFIQTQSINNFSSGWTQIVSVGDNLLFYRSDGLGAVGHIDPQGAFVQTQSINTFSPGWTQIVPEDVPTIGQRKSVNALTPDELMSLRRGVAQMMTRNNAPRDSADFRRSWVYWANMHAHFGPNCGGPISGSGMAGVQTFTASNPSETNTWCTCEHSPAFSVNERFLTWHRMYLWYFERVLQEAAGDPSLRLPFWDYATDPNLPAAYRDPTYVNEAGQTVPNPLRVNARQAGLNAGSAGLAPGVRSAAGAIQASAFSSFSDALEQTPHGAVHCAMVTGGCPNGLMGAVPASALDPIFYAHHTNLDRLYECWLQVDETTRLPTDPAHLNTQYTFVDADGSTPQRLVGDMLRLSQLDYSYAQGGDCPAVIVASAAGGMEMPDAAMAGSAREESFALAGPTRLERGITTVPISVPAPAREMLSARAMPSAEPRAYVVIEGLTYDEGPAGLYNVYLQGEGDQREQIGVISLFNFTAPRHRAHAGRYEFDVTDAMQRLALDAAAQPLLVFEPTTGLTDSSPEAAAEQISPEANVRFDSAQIIIKS